jgi:uncharacterized repeat protein (TIGR03847 family)
VNSSFDFTEPDHFVPGTVGPPGQRVFYVQARQGAEVVTLRLEKQQVAALCDYLAGILADLPVVTEPLPDTVDLLEPVVAEWVVGALAVAFEEADDRLLIVAEELVVDDEDDPDAVSPEMATARFRLTRAQVAAFIRRGTDLVVAGRPPCPICGRPMDPTGHVCPRSNGHGTH